MCDIRNVHRSAPFQGNRTLTADYRDTDTSIRADFRCESTLFRPAWSSARERPGKTHILGASEKTSFLE